jgi:hypothetical protein
MFILPHALGQSRVGRTQDLAGSWGIHSVPLPCSPTPAGPADLTLTVDTVLSPPIGQRRHQRVLISRLNHTASIPAAYASSSTLPYSHARLASGCWLGFTGREFNPLDSDERFLSNCCGLPPFPGLACRDQRPVPRYCGRGPSPAQRDEVSKAVSQGLVVPAGTKCRPNACWPRHRTGAPDPKLPAAIFWSTDRSTFEAVTRRNGSNEPRLGRLTFADARR